MSIKVGELYHELNIDDSKFNKGLDRAKNKSKGFGSFLKTGLPKAAAAGTAVAGAALAGLGAKGVKSFNDYEKKVNEVFTLLPEASSEAQNKMSSDLQDFSAEMGVMTDESAPALYQAISAGVPEDNVFNFLEQAQKAAVGGVSDLETAVDGMTSIVNTYGEANIDATEASDLMFTAVKQGKTTFDELSANISDVAPIASSLGIEFSNVTAALSTMTAQGVPTSKATTQLRQAMSELSKEGSQAGSAFEDVAGKSFQDFINEGGNMQEAMALMEQAAEENDTSVANMFGSIEAGQAALALTGDGADTFAENLEGMNNSAGATEDAYNEMDDTLSRSFDKIKASGETMMIAIGEELRPVVADFANFIADNMPKIKSVVTTVFSGVVDAIYIGVDAFDVVHEVITDLFGSGGTAEEATGDFLSTFKETSESIVPIVNSIIDIVSAFWDLFGDEIINSVQKSLEFLARVTKNVFGVIEGLLNTVAGVMTGDFDRAVKGIAQVFEGTFDTVLAVVEFAVDSMLSAFDDMPKKVLKSFDDMFKDIKKSVGSIKDMMLKGGKNVIGGFLDGILDMVREVPVVGDRVAKALADRLVGQSPPPKGPLSEVDKGGYNVGIAWAEGVSKAEATVIAVANGISLAAAAELLAERKEFEEEWTRRYRDYTETRLETLQREKEEALAEAEELGADKADIHKLYDRKIQEERDKIREEEKEERRKAKEEEEQAEKERLERMEEDLQERREKISSYLSDYETMFSDFLYKKLHLDKVNREKMMSEAEKQLEKEKTNSKEELEKKKQDRKEEYEDRLKWINENVSDKEKADRLKTEAEKSYNSDIKELTEKGKNKRKEILEEFQKEEERINKETTTTFGDLWDDVIANVKKKLIEMAASKAFEMIINMATGGTGGTIIETGKSILKGIGGLFGFADGALVSGPTMAMVGEGRDEEAVLPLNNMVFQKLGRGISSNLPNNSSNQTININANYHIKDRETAEMANNDLVRKLERRGLGGALN